MKSAAVREYFAEHPKAMPKEVVAALKQKGINVSSPMVSLLKGKLKKGNRRRKAGSNGVPSVESLLEAKKFAVSLGGISQAQEALADLAKLI